MLHGPRRPVLGDLQLHANRGWTSAGSPTLGHPRQLGPPLLVIVPEGRGGHRDHGNEDRNHGRCSLLRGRGAPDDSRLGYR